MANILWIDNDRIFLTPFVERLKKAGYKPVRAYTVSDAERLLKENDKWDLVIIDPMMNISEEEEKDYPPSRTDGGLKVGVIFYERNRQRIQEIGAKAVVLTMRYDDEIIREFEGLGIPVEMIKYKMDVSDTADFLEWVKKMLGEKAVKNG